MPTYNNLHEYQKRGVTFIRDHPHCGLFLSMGLGKSITTLTAIAELIDESEVNRVLVIAPKKVAESTWSDEIHKWTHTRHLTYSLILGDEKKRKEALEKKADIYVTSRDLFCWLASQYLGSSNQPLKSKPWPFDMVVIDELTSFKSSTSKRFKAFKRLRPYMPRVIGLTGTPTPNGMKDLWGQMYCIDMGRSLGHSKTSYINTFFNTYGQHGVIYRLSLKKDAEKDITRLISHNVLTMRAEDYLELPPAIEQKINVRLSPQTMAKYKQFEKDCVLKFDTEQEPIALASNAAVLCNKLLQFCNGAIYEDEIYEEKKPHQVRIIHDEKLDTALEIIEQAHEEGNSILVFYEFQHDAQRIMDALHQDLSVRKYKDEKDLRDWNAGKIDVLLAHPASTAYGLNMQAGGHIILWYGTGWNSELYLQGNARLARQGQTQPVIIYQLICFGTMDEKALDAVKGKVGAQASMIKNLIELKALEAQ